MEKKIELKKERNFEREIKRIREKAGKVRKGYD